MADIACRSCDQRHPDDAAIDAMIGELGLPDDQRSSPEVEARRLAGCRDCEYLSGYGTCLMCGCLVRVRAVHATARCPHPIQGRWQAGY